MTKYEPSKIESKWQAVWSKNNLYKVDLSEPSRKFYLLVEFTYPSGDLHMGHWFAFAVPDILARFKRMHGYNVFAPNGFDAFGLPAENAAIKRGVHPKDWTYLNIARMKQQFSTMGAIYDWEHEVITCDAEYYRWNQWIFLKMYEKGLAYRAKALANWCGKDKCVLANENVENGRCWRCGEKVVQKEVEQWFLKITDYAERLLWSDHEPGSKNSSEPGSEKAEGAERSRIIDWPKSLKDAQNNWIGKSEGIEIKFQTPNSLPRRPAGKLQIEVFTTRPDTLYGATFLVLAPEHPLVSKIVTKNYSKDVASYQKASAKKSELERKEMKEKTGVFTGAFVTNPVNGQDVPIWVADYVLMGYGTGAIMAVPAHDQRDFEFAKKYDLPIKQVILRESPSIKLRVNSANREVTLKTILRSKTSLNSSKGKFSLRSNNNGNDQAAYSDSGVLINSGEWNGWRVPQDLGKVIDWLERKRIGKRQIQYHLHDWSISRQRYWGTPIPIIYCRKCWENSKLETRFSQENGTNSKQRTQATIIDGKEYAIVPVPEKDLPVELPYDVDFAPKGKPPLATAEDWVKVKCPNCGGEAKREVETMDTFVDSSWYFLRYLRKISENSAKSESQRNQKIRKSDQSDIPTDLKFRQSESSEYSEKLPFDPDLVAEWMPVDIYFGGAEHTLGHTLYSRFFVKFLQDIGVVPQMSEYAQKRVHHGVILGPDGARMSKSHENVVNPDDEVKQYGADAVRIYLAFLGPYDLVAPWDPGGIRGVYNFLVRTWKLSESVIQRVSGVSGTSESVSQKSESLDYRNTDTQNHRITETPNHRDTELSFDDLYWMHKTIKKVTDDIESIKFNTAVAALMEWLNYLSAKVHREQETRNTKQETGKKVSSFKFPVSSLEYEVFLKLLAPFAPHITEELWEFLGNSKLETRNSKLSSIHDEPWPEYDPKLAQAKAVTLVVQVNGKVRDKLLVEAGTIREEAEKLALKSARVRKYLGKKLPQKVIFVPGRLINFVLR